MKKTCLIALLCSILGTVHAQSSGVYIELAGEHGTGKSQSKNGEGFQVAPYIVTTSGIKYDVKFENTRATGLTQGQNNPISAVVEPRIRYGISLTDTVTAGVRLGIGQRLGAKDFTYYTVEPIVEWAITPRINMLASFKHRDAFNSENPYLANFWTVGAGYKLTPQDTIGVKVASKTGDAESNVAALSYNRSF